MSNNSKVVDKVAKEGGEGMAATLFVKSGDEYIRIATTLSKTKAIGTALTGPALNAIKADKPSYGEASVLGAPYVSGYGRSRTHPVQPSASTLLATRNNALGL